MPLPLWAATAGLSAAQNPEIQNAALGIGRAGINGIGNILGGLGRGAQYLGQGALNRAGDLGNAILPQGIANIGTQARRGIYGFGQAVAGARPDQGIMQALGVRGQEAMPQMGGQGGPGMQGMANAYAAMNPERMMQQNYMNEIQQPYVPQIAAQEQQIRNQYNQQQLPQLYNAYAGAGAGRGGGFLRALRAGETNLATNLAALGENAQQNAFGLNQGRLNNIGQYLGNQQQLGLGARRLGLEERDMALRQLGLMGQYGNNQQGNQIQQLIQAINAQGGLGNIAMGQAFQPVQHAGAPAWGGQLLGGLGQGLAQGGRLGVDIARTAYGL